MAMKLTAEEKAKAAAVKAAQEKAEEKAAENAARLEAKRATPARQFAAEKRRIAEGVAMIKNGGALLITRRGIDEKATAVIKNGLFAIVEARDVELVRSGLAAALDDFLGDDSKLAPNDLKSLKRWLKAVGITRNEKGKYRVNIPFSSLDAWKKGVESMPPICEYRPEQKKPFEAYKIPVGEEIACVKDFLEKGAAHFEKILEEKGGMNTQEKKSLEYMAKLLRQLKPVVGC